MKISNDMTLQDVPDTVIKPEPHIYCHFATGIGEPKYFPVPTWPHLNNLLTEALDNYNEVNAVMNLVLFEDAVAHMYAILYLVSMNLVSRGFKV